MLVQQPCSSPCLVRADTRSFYRQLYSLLNMIDAQFRYSSWTKSLSAAASTSDQSRSALLLRIHGAVYEAEYPLIQSIAYPKGYPDRDQSSYSNTTSAGEKQQTSGSHGKCMESPLPVAAATDVSRNTGTKATDRASSDAGNFERNLPAKLTCRDEGERNNGVDGNDQPSRGQAHAAAAGTRSEERPSIQTGSRKRKFGDVSIRSMEERPTLAALAAQGAPSSSRLYRGSPHRHGADNSLTREYEHNGVQEVNPDRCEHRANNSGSRAEEASDRGATKIRRNYATTSGEGRSHRGVGGDDCAEVPFCSLLFPSILLKFWVRRGAGVLCAIQPPTPARSCLLSSRKLVMERDGQCIS